MDYKKENQKNQSRSFNSFNNQNSSSPISQRYVDNRPEMQEAAQLYAAIQRQTINTRPSFMPSTRQTKINQNLGGFNEDSLSQRKNNIQLKNNINNNYKGSSQIFQRKVENITGNVDPDEKTFFGALKDEKLDSFFDINKDYYKLPKMYEEYDRPGQIS